ncbi:MAG: DUF4339 domain-containing protein [Planctomycetaceae bacterium]
MSDWYYAIDGQQFGPISNRELHDLAGNGGLQPTDLVWQDGFGDWRQASTVTGLFPAGAGTSPAGPPPVYTQPEFAETFVAYDDIGAQPVGTRTPEELKIPLLISAISNSALALIWVLTCVFSFLAIPLAILAWYEVKLYRKVDLIPNDQFGSEVKGLAPYQIAAGVLGGSIPSLVCGILLMIKGGEHADKGLPA